MDGVHPQTGEVLGRRFMAPRVREEGELRAKTTGGAPMVRGFDATCSAPKSVSLLWAVGDGNVRFEIFGGHVASVQGVVGYVEAQARTRYRLGDGTIVCVDAQGITAALVHQFTSRSGDPQIHTHALISAKVQAPDGRWLALDARALKCDQQTLSRLYHAGLEAELSRRLGVEWGEPTGAGHRDIAGVDRSIVEGFSARAAQSEAAIDAGMARWVAKTGREPLGRERWQIHRDAVASSRPAKSADPVDAFQRWEAQLVEHHRITGEQLVGQVVGRHVEPVVHTPEGHDVRARAVFDALASMRSVWRPAELLRDLAQATPPVTGHTAAEVIADLQAATVRVIAERCIGISTVVERPAGERALDDPASEVPRRVSDGRPVTSHALDDLYTTTTIVAEESYVDQVIGSGLDDDGARRENQTVAAYQLDGVTPDAGQLRAAGGVAGRDGFVLVEGPAGTGKTTMLATAVAALHDQGRVVFGCAPSAAAAHELAASTGLHADTLAKLLWEYDTRDGGPTGPYRLRPGTTVIVDEAGMVATPDIARLVSLAQLHEWRVVMVGDGQQLSAVGRGGMFDHLVDTHPDVVYRLGVVQRFHEPWERDASLDLRRGRHEILDTYQAHGRLRPTVDLDTAITAAVDAWFTASGQGGSVLVTAATNDTVTAINTKVQERRLAAGELTGPGVRIDSGGRAHVGDVVVTRRNDRDLLTSKHLSVANRHTFTVTNITPDGGVVVAGKTGTVTLPPGYVTEHVQLAYASTTHGAQGRTVDRAIAVVEPATDHHGFYVAMTRGRASNVAIVPTPEEQTPVDVLGGVLVRDWADRPAIVRAVEVETQQRVDVPAKSVMRTPATARQQQATVEPARSTRMLDDDAVRRLIAERNALTTRLELAPRRLEDTARQLDAVNERIAVLEPKVVKGTMLLDEARAELAKASGWLNRLPRAERERYVQIVAVVPARLAVDQADLRRLVVDRDRLTVVHADQRDILDRGPGRIDSLDKTIRHGAHTRLDDIINNRAAMPPALGGRIIDRLGPRPTDPARREQWTVLVADAVQTHALTGQVPALPRWVAPTPALALVDTTSSEPVYVYSRAQLRTIADELAGLRPDDPARDVLQQAWTDDAYTRLGHALNNPHTINPDLADHVLNHLGQRPEHDHHASEWERHAAEAVQHHAHTGQLAELPDWREHTRGPDITPHEQAPQRAREQERDYGPDLGR